MGNTIGPRQAPARTYGDRIATEVATLGRRVGPRRSLEPRPPRRWSRRRVRALLVVLDAGPVRFDPAAVLARCRPAAVAVARRITDDADAADDAVADALADAVERPHEYTAAPNWRALFMRAVRSRAAAHARAAGVRHCPIRTVNDAAAPASADPLCRLIDAEALGRVAAAVEALHPRRREALERFALAGQPRHVAAAAMGVNVHTVSQLAWEARASIRADLAGGADAVDVMAVTGREVA